MAILSFFHGSLSQICKYEFHKYSYQNSYSLMIELFLRCSLILIDDCQ